MSTDWLARARDLVDEARHRLTPFGIVVEPELAVVAEPTPLPGYVHATRTIGFCPPVAETGVERLRWMVYAPTMGAGSFAEAVDFFDRALPLVIFHEVGHHVRMGAGRASDSPFVEEAVCEELAVALHCADAARRDALPALRERVQAMEARLAERLGAHDLHAFVPSAADALARTSTAIDPAALRTLAADAGLDVDALAALSSPDALRSAVDARDRAHRHLDAHYTADPAAYWYGSLAWLSAWLAAPERPTLAEVLRDHLQTAAPDDAPGARLALRGHLRGEPALRGHALAGLLAAGEDPTDPHLLAALTEPGPTRARCLAALIVGLQDVRLRPERVAPLVQRALGTGGWSAEEASRLLRVAALTGVPADPSAIAPAPTIPSDPQTRRLALEIAVHTGADVDPADLGEAAHAVDALADRRIPPPPRVSTWIPALAASGEPEHRARLLALFADRADAPPEVLRVALADLAAPRARAVLQGARSPEVDAPLPPRGGPRWDGLLALVGSSEAWRDALVRVRSPDRPVRERFLAAAALGDVGLVPDSALAEPDAVQAFLAVSRAFDDAGDRLAAEPVGDRPDAGTLATDVLRYTARRTCLQVVRALAPSAHRDAVGQLARTTPKTGPLDEERVRALCAAVPGDLRAEVRDLLTADGVRAVRPPAADPDAVEPAIRTVLAGLCALSAELDAVLRPSVTGLAPLEDPVMISEVERAVWLHGVPLFAALSPGSLRELAAAAVVRDLPDGAVLTEVSTPSEALYVVLVGEIEVRTHDGDVEVAVLGPGSCVGEVGLFDRAPPSARTLARGPTRVLSLARRDVQAVGRRHPKVYEELLRVVAQRLRATVRQVAELRRP